MSVGYRASSDFDAKREAEELLDRFANPGEDLDRLCTVIDMIESLEKASRLGFSEIAYKWDATVYDGIFIYSNAAIHAAIVVPGSGRGETHDLTFLGVVFVEARGDEEHAVKEFLLRMNDRRNSGTRHGWY
jgi:hypothetical protein